MCENAILLIADSGHGSDGARVMPASSAGDGLHQGPDAKPVVGSILVPPHYRGRGLDLVQGHIALVVLVDLVEMLGDAGHTRFRLVLRQLAVTVLVGRLVALFDHLIALGWIPLSLVLLRECPAADAEREEECPAAGEAWKFHRSIL